MNNGSSWRGWIPWMAAAAVVALLWWRQEPGRNGMPALVGAGRHQLGATEPSRVSAVFVKPGDAVRAGQPLVELDCSDVNAELAVARAEAEEQLAQVEAMAAELNADAARRRVDIETEFARVRATLAAEKGLQQAQRAELDALTEQMKRLDEAIRNRVAEMDRLAALRARQLRLVSRAEHGPEVIQAWAGVAEQVRATLDKIGGEEIAARLRPVQARVETQSQRIQRLLERQGRCTVRSPVDGRVSLLPRASGDAVPAGSTVAVVIGANAAYVTAYLPENGMRPPSPGDTVSVYPRDRGGAATARGLVEQVGPEIVEMPSRLWLSPARPRYGRPVHIAVDTGAGLVPGEVAFAYVEGGHAQAAPTLAEMSFPARVPEGLRARTRLELSGLAWLPERDRFVAVSDDTGYPHAADGEPIVFTADAHGQLDPEPLRISGVEAVSDLEAVTRAPDGTVYLLASQSLSRAGRRPVKRQWLLRTRLQGDGLAVTGKAALYDGLLAGLGADRRVELGVSDGLDLEGLAWHDGALLVGLKAPLDDAGRARIWRLAGVDGAEFAPAPSLFASVALPTCAAGSPGGISDLYAEGNRLYLLSTLPEGTACGSAWRAELPLGDKPPRKLADWPDLKPEGVARAGKGSLMIAFDAGDALPRFALVAEQ